ncbi:MAG: PEP-CTERM sorting domain-containing protein [Candidatus Omnitrophica bacterium]|nr:PEP-CTERM sorting domain-containing protein [Candidatus Omnitrophota bacterium]
MKIKELFRVLVILAVSITFPMVQVYAVVPDTGSILQDVKEVESTNEQSESSADASGPQGESVSIPVGDLFQSDVFVSNDKAVEELEADSDYDEAISDLLLPEKDQKFWTGKKILLTTLLLLLLLGGSSSLFAFGGGGGGDNGGTGGGGGSDDDGGSIPHHPEPSTLLLMGLGLLIPFLRKKS